MRLGYKTSRYLYLDKMSKDKVIKIIRRTLNGYPQLISCYLFGSIAENIDRAGDTKRVFEGCQSQ